RQRTIPGFTVQPQTIAVGHYVGVLSDRNRALRDRINDILQGAMQDGSLERILRRWNVWNDDQPKLYAHLLAGEPVPPVVAGAGFDHTVAVERLSPWDAARRYFPSPLQASVITIVLSCRSMT